MPPLRVGKARDSLRFEYRLREFSQPHTHAPSACADCHTNLLRFLPIDGPASDCCPEEFAPASGRKQRSDAVRLRRWRYTGAACRCTQPGCSALSFWRCAVRFHQHCIVDIVAKGFLNRFKIRLVPITGELHAVRQPLAQIVDEGEDILAVAIAYEPRAKYLRVDLDRRPRPRIAAPHRTAQLGIRRDSLGSVAPIFPALRCGRSGGF
jgi:hypothetical protein